MDPFEILVRGAKTRDPFQAGIEAFERGQSADRCPRYPSSYDREKWHRGFTVAMRQAIRAYQQRQDDVRQRRPPKVTSVLV